MTTADTITARISAAVHGSKTATRAKAPAQKKQTRKRVWTDEQKNAYKLAKRAEYEQLALLSKSLKEGENFGLEMYWSANPAAHNWYCDSSQYSELNSALIAIQLGRTPTEVHTAAAWKARKIWIKKGEHALKIWVPVIEEEKAQVKTDENGTILTEEEAEKAKEEGRLKCWRVGNVFDRSQTTAAEPTQEEPEPAVEATHPQLGSLPPVIPAADETGSDYELASFDAETGEKVTVLTATRTEELEEVPF